MPEKLECFVIAPIGTDKSETRTRSDLILKYVIRPVAEECGYVAVRADEISEPGSITTQVLNRILEVPMVVADLTGMNANVFYELAVRHAIRKPYVQIIQKGERIPFDVAGIRTIEIDHANLESVDIAKSEIAKQMRFSMANLTKIASPISIALDLASLTQSENPVERQVADVLTGLADVKRILDDRFEYLVDTLADLARAILPVDLARAILPEDSTKTAQIDGPAIEALAAIKKTFTEIARAEKRDQKDNPKERPPL